MASQMLWPIYNDSRLRPSANVQSHSSDCNGAFILRRVLCNRGDNRRLFAQKRGVANGWPAFCRYFYAEEIRATHSAYEIEKAMETLKQQSNIPKQRRTPGRPPVKTRFLYGPVPSRRLGRSLGVDLVPFKTCSYDCIYCQLGRTTNKTTERREYVPVDSVLHELTEKLRNEPTPDFIGLAGSGEPTLHAQIGDLIAGIKSLTSVPVAVLTNGSLLWMPEVRASLAEADLVMPSLDAGTKANFERVNRPHPKISFEKMVDGLSAFSHGFKGKVWLELFVLNGITDRPEEIERIAAISDKIRPARLQLNTVARPPAERDALAVSSEFLASLLGRFSIPCEVIAENYARPVADAAGGQDAEHEIAALLGRRPCTVEGIAIGLGLRPNEVLKHLEVLCTRGTVRSERRGDAMFYEGVRNI